MKDGKLALLAFVLSKFPEDPKALDWLEIGCADYSNLLILKTLGVENLFGVEVNNSLLEAGIAYDEVATKSIQVTCGLIEDFSNNCERRFDVLFSCAVMQHINPLSNEVFGRLARIAKKYIVTIEAENQCNRFHYPRNYRRMLERYGFEQLDSVLFTTTSFEGVAMGMVGYTLRIFARH